MSAVFPALTPVPGFGTPGRPERGVHAASTYAYLHAPLFFNALTIAHAEVG